MTMTAKQVAAERERRARGKGGKADWVKIKPDTVVYLRIGPPWKKEGEVWKDCYFHGYYPKKVYCANNDIDEDTGKKRKCSVERRLLKLKGEKSKSSKKLWSLLNQKCEGLWNVLVVKKYRKLSNGKIIVKAYEDNRFKILRLAGKWHNLLLDVFSDEDLRKKSILGVTHPRYGRLVKVKRVGSDADDTNYSFDAVDRESPISKNKAKRLKLLGTLVNLDRIVQGSSDEELQAYVRRMEKLARKLAKRDREDDHDDEDDEEDEDDDEETDSDDDDDEDEEEEDSDDEDDLEKQYQRLKKKSKKHKSKREDDDEEDEDEDEE